MYKQITRLFKNALKISFGYNENNKNYCYLYSVKKFEETKSDSVSWWGSAVPFSELRVTSSLELAIRKNSEIIFKMLSDMWITTFAK